MTTTLRFQDIPEMALTARDEAVIAAHLARCFDTDFGGRSFFRQRHHLRLLAWQGDHLAGHIAVTFRSIRIGTALTPIAGLAEVATAAEARGQGIAAALLQRAIDAARASLSTHLLLFGTAGLYAGAGFAAVTNPMTYLDLTDGRTGEVRTERAESLMVLPLRDARWDKAAPLDLMGHLF
jgi:predicted N-acetyltransferase YhbS